MLTLLGAPQGAEWLIIGLIFGAVSLFPIALLVWLIFKLARRGK